MRELKSNIGILPVNITIAIEKMRLRSNFKTFLRKILRRKYSNEELFCIYENIISEWVQDCEFENEKLQIMLQSLIDTDIQIFEELFSEFVRDTLSYFDVHKENEEQVYHAFLLGLLLNLKDYEVISNKESGYGRIDIMLLHKEDKTLPAIIIELKAMKKYLKETPEKALENALIQIEEKQYEAEARKRGYHNICKLAAVFDGKRVRVKEQTEDRDLSHRC